MQRGRGCPPKGRGGGGRGRKNQVQEVPVVGSCELREPAENVDLGDSLTAELENFPPLPAISVSQTQIKSSSAVNEGTSKGKGKEGESGVQALPRWSDLTEQEEADGAEKDQPLKPKDSVPKSSWASVVAKNRDVTGSCRLEYIPPKNGVVYFDDAELAYGAKVWENAVVGYALGSTPKLQEMVNFAKGVWKGIQIPQVYRLKSGVFLFNFNSGIAKKEVLDRVWSFKQAPLILKSWSPDMNLEECNPDSIPVWVTLQDFDMQQWTTLGISKVASALGKPLATDLFTHNRQMLGYARVLVEVKVNQEIKEEIWIKHCTGKTISEKVHYEWDPKQCPYCKVWGHKEAGCAKKYKESEQWLQKEATESVPVSKPRGARKICLCSYK